MIATALLALLTGSDAVPAAWLVGHLVAAEAAYAHVEADGRFTAGGRTYDESYVGSRGHGYRLNSVATDRPGRVLVTLSNPAYRADAGRMPGNGWVLLRVSPPDPGRPLHPHAPVGRPDDPLSYRDHLARRAGRLRVVAGSWAGRPVWTATFPVGPTGTDRAWPSPLTLDLTADPPVVVLAARIGPPGRPEAACEITYQPGDDWPAVRTVRYRAVGGDESAEQLVEFTRYQRLDAPPPADRFTLTTLGLPEPDPATIPVPATAEPEAAAADPPDDRWQWWAIAGIVVVGAVAFWRAGRRPG